MRNRSSGTLTGSRVAGMLGRVPVESIIVERHHHWRQWGYLADTCTLTVSTYVDNLFSASRSLHGAIAILEDFEQELDAKWGLRIKPASRSCTVSRGSTEAPACQSKWPLCAEFRALGHVLQDNGDSRACWTQTKRNMWRAFFGNCSARASEHLGVDRRYMLLQRSVVPLFDYRNTRWPPHNQLGKEIDQVQRKMVAAITRVPSVPDDSPERYVRRRNSVVKAVCEEMGWWSARHCKRVVAWRDHLQRPANSWSWPAVLYEFRGSDFLARLRAAHSSNVFGGRTGTRVAPGHVATRWHDSVRFAEACQS